MKRIVIRLTCILFLFAFSLTINVNAISIAPFLDAIGVYGEGGIGEPVRREEFALVAANLCEDTPLVNSTAYSDVPQQSQYAEAIKIVTGQGIMNGVGDGKFGYGATIRSLDAVCVLVRILGYEDAAKQREGYPNGYLFIADKIKLTKGIDITGNLTHEIMAELVYRAIDTGISNVTYLMDESIVYTADGDNTILRERMKLSRVQKGVVQANEYGAMDGLSACGKDEMIIDGQIFKTKNFAQKQLLGYAVEFVYGLEDRNVAYIEPAGESVKFSGDKVVDFDTKSITYEQGGKDARLALKDVAYIYNGEIIYPTKEQLKTMFEGASSITAIKNDGGSSYNVVKFEIPTYYIVSAMDGNTIYTKEGFQVDISEVPALDGFDNPLMKSQVQANSVLGVFHGFSGGGIMYVKVINDWVKGTVEGISNEGVKIAGAWYKVAGTVTLKVGDTGTFFLNEAMEIVSVDIEEASSFSYGYLRSIGGDTGFGAELKANIYTVDDKFSNFNFADKCKVGGRNLDQDQMKAQVLPALIASSDGRAKYSQMVKYTLNSKGEINSFESMPKQMEFSSMHQGGIFYLGATIYAYADSATRCFVLPDKDDFYNEDAYSIMTGDDFAFNTRYDGLIAYDIDLKEGTRKAKCLAMYATTSATDRADANTTGLVEEVYKSITEDDIEVDTVVLRMPGGSTKTLNIKDVIQPYEPGDLVCYTSTDKVIKPAKAQIIAKGKNIAATPAGVGLFGGSTNDHLYVYLGAIRNLKDGYAMVGAADAAPGTCYPYDISNLKTVLIQKRTEDGVKYTKETPQILGIYKGTNTKVLVISKFLNTVGFVILEEE